LAYARNTPKEADAGMTALQIDRMCMGKKTDLTPVSDIATVYLIKPSTFMPNNMDLNDITRRWEQAGKMTGSTATGGKIAYNFSNIIVKEPVQVCENRDAQIDDGISVQILNIKDGGMIARNFSVRYTLQANNPIAFVRFSINDILVGEQKYSDGRTTLNDIKKL
jgi:hypothetical protein